MGEIYGNAWTNQFGQAGEGAWETWCKAMDGLSVSQVSYGVNRVIDERPKFPPNLPEFLSLCGLNREQQMGLAGKDLSFPHLMNVACSGDKRKISELNPALYWIYRKLDLFAWKRMETRQARKVFNALYDQALQASESELIEPPLLLEDPDEMAVRQRQASEARPEYVSKRKQAAASAIDNLKNLMAGRA